MQKVCGLELQAGSQVTLEVKGKVTFKGGVDGDGIRVHPGAELNLKGSGNLYCSGNNEKERIILSKAPLGLYYGTVGFDSFVPKATDLKEIITPEAKADYATYSYFSGNVTHPAGGSGIGYAHQKTGKITITGDTQAPLNIVAKGFGRSAYGIGGDGADVHITNAIIDEAQGGYSTINKFTETDGVRQLVSTESFADRFINELNTFNTTDYSEADDGTAVMAIINNIKHPEATDATKALIFETGSKEAEGGCAIGACHNGNNTSNLYLENVQINKAIGGSKSAAIGGSYWAASNITMKECTLKNIIGGNSAAGIGSGRYYKSSPNPVTINIENTSLENVTGGYFAAAIGSGYSKDTLDMSKGALCTINITGNSNLTNITGGLAAAAIGTGFHQGMLTGAIESTVTLNNVKAGPSWVNLDYANLTTEQQTKYFANSGFGAGADNRYGTLSKPQDIGYGTLFTHGVSVSSTEINESEFEYTINGKECINCSYLKDELNWVITGLDSSDLVYLQNLAKTDSSMFGKFDNQFHSGGSAFTVNNQMIANPRRVENNLSKNIIDCPTDWEPEQLEPEPEPVVTLSITPAAGSYEVRLSRNSNGYTGCVTGGFAPNASSDSSLTSSDVSINCDIVQENSDEIAQGFFTRDTYYSVSGNWETYVELLDTDAYNASPNPRLRVRLTLRGQSIVVYYPIVQL